MGEIQEMRGFERIDPSGKHEAVDRLLAQEVPVALEFNGIGYATLMATPADLEDLARGFALSERLIDRACDILDLEVHPVEGGFIVRTTLVAHLSDRLFERVRHCTTDSSCGLCGIENIEQAMRPLPSVAERWSGSADAVFAAAAALSMHQPLNRATGSVHAAAQCAFDGTILAVREDVGRHNAFDKLIGAMLHAGAGWDGGFALLSSRCSYELVEKAAISGCPMLATISAPTDLALRRAREAGLTLHVLVRPDALLAARV